MSGSAALLQTTERPSDGVAVLSLRPSRLEGRVRVSGAKNSVLRLLAASLLTSDDVVLDNHPEQLLDAQIHVGMLEALGKRCRMDGGRLTIAEVSTPPGVLVWRGRSIRNTLLILGALLARTGGGSVPLPGGCDIGDRKYDLHELVFRRLGAEVWREGDRLYASSPGRLRGADIVLPLRSTGATENAILCGVLAEGRTRIFNPHVRPEILDLIAFLTRMGAKIESFGQQSIEIDGVDHLGGTKWRVMPDAIEAMTWLIGSAITGGDVEIESFPVEQLEAPLLFLRESGVKIERRGDVVLARGNRCWPVEISTGPYPGINSDLQPLFAAFGVCAQGESRVCDLRFPDRYGYSEQMAKLGVSSRVEDGVLRIAGGQPLRGAEVRALDLRAGVALALLGLVAEGETRVSDAWQIDRGYVDFSGKLNRLGASVHPEA